MPTLILTPRFTEDAQQLWRAASQLGWGVERLVNWRVPEALRAVSEPVLYLEGLMAPDIAEAFGLKLLDPAADWLPRLPEEYRKRKVELTTLKEAKSSGVTAFIKPPNDKVFPAKVYRGCDLPDWYGEDSPLLVAEVVHWEKEFRCFVLDRQVRAMSIYLREGVLQKDAGFACSEGEQADAAQFAQSLLRDPRVDLPRATVLDIGFIAGRGWAAVEQNAAWGSGIYGCDPHAVLEVIRHAVVPAATSKESNGTG